MMFEEDEQYGVSYLPITTLKSEYIHLLHGELVMVNSFGMFYAISIQQNKYMNVIELSRFFANIPQRQKEPRKRTKKK